MRAVDAFLIPVAVTAVVVNKNNNQLPRFTSVWTGACDPGVEHIDYEAVDSVLAYSGDCLQEFIEQAHEKNTTVLWVTGEPVKYFQTNFTNATYRHEIVQQQVEHIIKFNYDGVNYDFEGETYTPEAKDNWVVFLEEMNIELKKLDPPKLLTMAIPYTPNEIYCFNGRCYPFKRIAEAIDYMVIMGYDAEEDWWGVNHYGHATDPYYRIFEGLRKFLDCLEIPPYKITLAVPWYSWTIDCLTRQDPPEARSKDRQFQCSRRSLEQIDRHEDWSTMLGYFFDVDNRVDVQGNDLSEGAPYNYYYSDVEDSFFFHTKVPDTRPMQIKEHWMTAVPGNYTPYENRLKLAVDAGLSGLGLWSVKKLNYNNPQNAEEAEFNAQMWSLFAKYSALIDPQTTNPFPQEEYINNLCRPFLDRYVEP